MIVGETSKHFSAQGTSRLLLCTSQISPWQVLSCSLALAVLVPGHLSSTQLPRGLICDNSSSAWPKDGSKIGCPIILTTFLRQGEDKISCKLEELDEFCIA